MEAKKANRIVQIQNLTKKMGQFLIDFRNEKQPGNKKNKSRGQQEEQPEHQQQEREE